MGGVTTSHFFFVIRKDKTNMDITNIVADKLEAVIPFDGIPGFSVKVAYLGRPELTKLRKAATTNNWDPATRRMTESLDEDVYIEEFTKSVILGWEGLTFKYLKTLIPTNQDAPDDTVVDYTLANAVALIKLSPRFDDWVNGVTMSLESFRHATKGTNSKGTE